MPAVSDLEAVVDLWEAPWSLAEKGVAERLMPRLFAECYDLAEVAIDRDSFGRPFCRKGEIEFNLSHCQGKLLVACTRGRRVGCDVEVLKPRPNLAAIAERYFTKREQTEFRALTNEQQLAYFFRIWTRKEALSKMLGLGLQTDWHKLETLEPTQGQLIDLEVGQGHKAALATSSAGFELRRHSLPRFA